MEFARFFIALVASLVLAGTFGCATTDVQRASSGDNGIPGSISQMDPTDPGSGFGPSFSSPRVRMTPNGDRVGHYPPYYYPDH